MLKTFATAVIAVTLLAAPALSGIAASPAAAATTHALQGKVHKDVKPIKHARHGHRHHGVKQVRHHRHVHANKRTARAN
jgi:hypothetical protein